MDRDSSIWIIKPNVWFEGDTEDALWEETFSTWTDSKPKGEAESLEVLLSIFTLHVVGPNHSIDINFPNYGTVYGIPQHATTDDGG
jgi:alpha 1,3-glucosidase